MKRDELKKMLKPLIKECIKEVMFEQGTLSTIVSEVVKGLGNPVISESRSSTYKEPKRRAEADQEVKKGRKHMIDAIGKESYNGVNLFEGTTPAPAPSNKQGQGALSGVDPNDPGVDISGLMGASNTWSALMGN